MRFKGTLFDSGSRFGTRVERHFDVEWSEDAVLGEGGPFSVPTLAEKLDQQLWGFARYAEGANRGTAGLEAIYGAALDKDCADVGEMDAVAARLDELGLAYILYSSWSHRYPLKAPNDMPEMLGPFDCFRVVLPYDREVSPGEHRSIVMGLFGHELLPDPDHYRTEVLGRFVKLASGRERAAKPRGWDPCATRPAQGYFVPVNRADDWPSEPIVEVVPGRPLEVEKILARETTPEVSWRRPRPF